MITHKLWRLSRLGLGAVFCASCTRAPSFEIVGSFFPVWMLCMFAGLLLTFATRWLLLRLHVVIAFPVLTYLSLTTVFTLALWLAFVQ